MTHTHQLYACLALAAYLAPCAWQDLRTRKVSNWLTLPAFVVAWPLAIWFGNLEWAVAVFVGCYVAWQFKGMGAADGKLATLMAAIHPILLVLSILFLAVGFMRLQVIAQRLRSLPAAVFYLAASLILTLYFLYKVFS